MTEMNGYNYIITIAKADTVLDLVIKHGEVGKVSSTKTSKFHKTFKVFSTQRVTDLRAILAGNGDYDSTIVRLGSQTGEPLTSPIVVHTLN